MQKYAKMYFTPKNFLSLALLIMLILFISSSMTYQQQTSVPFLERYLATKPFLNLLSHIELTYAGSKISIGNLGYYKFIEFFIRKGAHFVTYFLLGLFLNLGLPLKRFSGLIAVLIAFLYAAFDEFHQMLTGGRTPLLDDVMLDTCGAILAVIIVTCLKNVAKRHRV